ncbi:DUF2530 domain-containing protein [Actinocatenispora sera]|uniref:DUF2530 domain-containing protein n=1 Tax=Actinocatenispora sera TaxID=390989 RepID=A0A810KVA2_9ACTN|nr:DUF2530 domain-containing protein [Actinocatenispora sera]BCJ26279.1 DUF2530 domain-containing protein [Actinocatenispora sera]
MRRYPPRPVPEPLDTNAVPVVLIGMALWLAAGLVLVFLRAALGHAHHGWWLWTCVAGLIIGIVLLGYEWHRRWRRAVAARSTDDTTAA